MKYCVGLTGNLASGKSTAAQIFSKLGVDVINADKISRSLTEKNQPAYQSIIAHFGSEVVLEDGQLNRKRLRDIIFANEQQRKWLEHLLHPLIRHEIEQQISLCTSDYCIIEIPLLMDRKPYPYLNRVLLITAPIEIQITRVQERDQCSREQALAILATQPAMKQRVAHADDVVENDSSLDVLRFNIEQLHHRYLELAQQPDPRPSTLDN